MNLWSDGTDHLSSASGGSKVALKKRRSVTGAGGFIAGNLALYFKKKGFTNIRTVDKKPLYEWYLHVPGVENLCLDVSNEGVAAFVANANEVSGKAIYPKKP